MYLKMVNLLLDRAVLVRDLCECLEGGIFRYSYVLLLTYVVSGGALVSPSLLSSSSIIALALHNTTILTITIP